MTARARLEGDRAEFTRSVDATFRSAHEPMAAVLRTFAEASDEVLASVRVMPLSGVGLDPIIDRAARQAIKAANAARPAAFAPPVAPFAGIRTRERDLGNRPVLSVEAGQALALADRSKLYLLQKHPGDDDYRYWAVARTSARSIKQVPSRFPIDQRSESLRP